MPGRCGGARKRVFFFSFFFTACNSIRGAVGPQTLIRGDSGCFGGGGSLKVLPVKAGDG